jgi:hypothetical protein
MMKKLLTLLIILGLASVTNAGLVFTLNGEPQPDEITLESPSGEVELDLELGSGTIRAYDLIYELSNSQAELISSGATYPALFDLQGYAIVTSPQKLEITASQLFTPDLAAPQTLMQGMILHCLEPTDVVLTISTIGTGGNFWDGADVEPGTVLHTLLIHQVPEPMTIALLGLGGLFLRRRK